MAEINAANSGDAAATIRPTEAQLRWAQFHSKRRAYGVQIVVERLYQTPSSFRDVDGAYPEDGNSSTSISDAEIRQRRPKVSKGRRALLRVSRRDYAKRKEEIATHGYRGFQIAESMSDGEEDDNVLTEMFTTKRRRPPRKRGEEEEGRLKRFASAYTMIMSLTQTQPPEPVIEVPTKRWTRTADHIAASAQLEKEYVDPKWGIRRRPSTPEGEERAESQFNPHRPAVRPLLDRGASWMVHVPESIPAARDNIATYFYVHTSAQLPPESVVSVGSDAKTVSTFAVRAPGAHNFNQLVAFAQQRLIEKGSHSSQRYLQEKKSQELKLLELKESAIDSENRMDSREHYEAPRVYSQQYSYSPAKKTAIDNDNRADSRAHYESSRTYSQQHSQSTVTKESAMDRDHHTDSREHYESPRVYSEQYSVKQTKSYMPRMRRRDFLPNSEKKEEDYTNIDMNPEELRALNQVHQRSKTYLEALEREKGSDKDKKLGRTQELAQSFEAEKKKKKMTRTKEMVKSIEGAKTPKMRLRDFDEIGIQESEDDGLEDLQPEELIAMQNVITTRLEECDTSSFGKSESLDKADKILEVIEAGEEEEQVHRIRQLFYDMEAEQVPKTSTAKTKDTTVKVAEIMALQQVIGSRIEQFESGGNVDKKKRMTRAREMVLAFEGSKKENKTSRTRKLAGTFEKPQPPKMRLHHLNFRQEDDEVNEEAKFELEPEELVVMDERIDMHLQEFEVQSHEEKENIINRAQEIVDVFEAESEQEKITTLRQMFDILEEEDQESENPDKLQLEEVIAMQQMIQTRIEPLESGTDSKKSRRFWRAKMMARVFGSRNKKEKVSRIKQMVDLLERFPKPRMRLSKNFTFGQAFGSPYAQDEKEKHHRFSEPLETVGIDKQARQARHSEPCCAKCARPSPIIVKSSHLNENQSEAVKRESDFFEHVRQMQSNKVNPPEITRVTNMFNTPQQLAKKETDRAVPSKRESDFFAQLREKNADKSNRLSIDPYQEPHICADCQAEDSGEIGPEGVLSSVSPMHGTGEEIEVVCSSEGTSPLRNKPPERRKEDASEALGASSQPDLSNDYTINNLWNRGKSGLNSLTSTLNQQQNVAPIPENLIETAANVSGRVGSFFQMMRNKQDDDMVDDTSDSKGPRPMALDRIQTSERAQGEKVQDTHQSNYEGQESQPAVPRHYQDTHQSNYESQQSIFLERLQAFTGGSDSEQNRPYIPRRRQVSQQSDFQGQSLSQERLKFFQKGDVTEEDQKDVLRQQQVFHQASAEGQSLSQERLNVFKSKAIVGEQGQADTRQLQQVLHHSDVEGQSPSQERWKVPRSRGDGGGRAEGETPRQRQVFRQSGVEGESLSHERLKVFKKDDYTSERGQVETPRQRQVFHQSDVEGESLSQERLKVLKKDDYTSERGQAETPRRRQASHQSGDKGQSLSQERLEAFMNRADDSGQALSPDRHNRHEVDSDGEQPLLPVRSRAARAEQEIYEAMQTSTSKRKEKEYAPDEFDASALAAYRQKRESMTPTADDASSASSFRALPSGFRDVVKHYSPTEKGKGSPLPKQRIPQSNTGLSEEDLSNFKEETSKYSPFYHDIEEKNGNFEHDIIDTDGTTSDVSYPGINPNLLSSLMLSPDLLTKRHQQAVRAIEKKQWDDINYLINANPWLAEMSELTTKQYLLHKIAFFGAGSPPAPFDICQQLMAQFPAAVHKFDEDGNVPLHLAAASGHMKMIQLLGEEFQSGASIRNEDGMLPLHFTIASYGRLGGANLYSDFENMENSSPIDVIKTVLKFFPKAVAIADNDGNLPLHIAVQCLEGGIAIDVIYCLLDEADRQLQDPYGARFYNKIKTEEMLDDGTSETHTAGFDVESSIMDEDIHCNMVRNDQGQSPLWLAVEGRKGWQIIEALVSGPGGRQAAIYQGPDQNNSLHLLVNEFQDPTAALSVLKIVPETATIRNSDGMLPIEVGAFAWGWKDCFIYTANTI